jgi:hypothetical protein
MGPVAIVTALLVSFTVTLNPDGSGKAVTEFRLQPVVAETGVAPKAGTYTTFTAEQAKAWARTMLTDTEGVETWSDVTFLVLPDGAVLFKGTAYFKNLSAMPFPGALQRFSMQWKADPRGGKALSFDPAGGKVMPKAESINMIDPKMLEAIEHEQATWRSIRENVKAQTAYMSLNLTFKLPAPATEVSGFVKDDEKTLRFVFSGAKYFEAIDKAKQNAEFVGQCIQAKIDPLKDWCDPVLQEKIFGAKGPWTARVTGEMKPQFDYAAEANAALDAFPKLRQSVIPAPPVAPVPQKAAPVAGDSTSVK